ncbi:MAG: cytochrome c biogenesis protein ResB [Bacteroidales bacterium]
MWSHPWRYKESFYIVSGLLLIGFALEWATGGSGVPEFTSLSLNIVAGLLAIFVFTTGIFFREQTFVLWLSGIPAAISAVAGITFMALLMGLTMQHDGSAPGWVVHLGMSHVTSSWPYLLMSAYLLIVLGIAAAKRMVPFSTKNISYILNHLGLWIVIFSATFGATQIERLEMKLKEGEIEWRALDKKNNIWMEMPVAIRLNDFVLEQYAPKLGIVDNITGKILHENGKNVMLVDSVASGNMLGWNIRILTYLDQSGKAGGTYYFNNETGAAPAVNVEAISESKSDTVVGWVSCGSFNHSYEALKINNQFSLIMFYPEPKKFLSKIDILTPEGETTAVELEVNKPAKVKGWEIYQVGYDDQLGRWSDTSVIEFVRDPWLPFVYLGIFMMIAGAITLFWTGRKYTPTAL